MLLLLLLFAHFVDVHSVFFGCGKTTCPKLGQYPVRCVNANCKENFNVQSTAQELIKINSFTFEEYKVRTEDGYILTIFRIPPKANDDRKNKQPVFLQHGISTDCATWLDLGNRSLAFVLADQGYDVWIGNQRGNRYGRGHARYKVSDPKFWNFDLDDLAQFDLRAMLLKVAEITQKPGSIIYIGHSRGTTLMFMLASECPEEVRRLIKGFVALSPIAYFDLPAPLRFLARFAPLIAGTLRIFNINSLFSNMETIIRLEQALCPLLPYVCRQFLNVAFGKTSQFSPNDLLTFYSNFPTTISIQELEQYSSMFVNKEFRKFDLGKMKNLEKYGQEFPPFYNLTEIGIPTKLYVGKNDVFATVESTNRIYNELTCDKKITSVPIGISDKALQFNHIDFAFSENLDNFFYKWLLSDLTQWSV